MNETLIRPPPLVVCGGMPIMWTLAYLQQAPTPDPDTVAAAAVAAAAVLRTATTAASPFSDPIVIAMIGTQVIMAIGAIASGVVMVLNRQTVRNIQEQAHANTAGLLVVAKDTEAIKGHVNSEKTAAEGRLDTERRENALLREMLSEKTTTAQLLAQAVAARARTPPPSPVVPLVPIAAVVDPVAVTHLEHIENNTAAAAQALDDLAKAKAP